MAHVSHPFEFKSYFQQDWLDFVSEKDTKNKLEWREDSTGNLVSSFDLKDRLFRHPQYDLVVLHLKNEEHFEGVDCCENSGRAQ